MPGIETPGHAMSSSPFASHTLGRARLGIWPSQKGRSGRSQETKVLPNNNLEDLGPAVSDHCKVIVSVSSGAF